MTTDVRAPSVPIYLAGEFVETANALEVRNPADGSLVGVGRLTTGFGRIGTGCTCCPAAQRLCRSGSLSSAHHCRRAGWRQAARCLLVEQRCQIPDALRCLIDRNLKLFRYFLDSEHLFH